MSDCIEFFEIRQGDEGDWESICLVKTEENAKIMLGHLTPHYTNLYYHHVELVANVTLEMEEY